MVAVPAGCAGSYRELEERHGPAQDGTCDFARLVTVAAKYGVAIAVPEAGAEGERGRRMGQA